MDDSEIDAELKDRPPAETGLVGAASYAYTPRPFDDAPLESERVPYVREPVFNKMTMAGWAIAALTVWFLTTMILPVVVKSVKESIVRSLDGPPGANSNGKVTIVRDGHTVTITRGDKPTVKVSTPEAAPAPVAEPVAKETPVPPAPPKPKK